MNKVLAIAAIALRNAVRSRIVLLLLAMLLLAIVGLPLTIKGDGTVDGYVQILLQYTLGAVMMILSIATLWAGCAAVSLDISEHHIQLVVTKPVHRIQVWLGKWIGLLALNFVLLAICGVVTYGLLRWTTRDARLSAEDRARLREEVLVGRQLLPSRPIDVREAARRELADSQARGLIPPNMPVEQAYEAIRHNLLLKANSVPAHGTLEWVFDMPPNGASDHALLFKYRYSLSQFDLSRIKGSWVIRRAAGGSPYEHAEDSYPGSPQRFTAPAAAAIGAGPLQVTFSNISDSPVTVFFSPDNGFQLLVYESPFETNYLRALFILFCRLAFLSALGVAAGSLFSMPVASFASFCFLLFIQAAGYLQSVSTQDLSHAHAHEHGATLHASAFWDHLFRVVFKAVHAVVRPLQDVDPLELLAAGQIVPWSAAVRAALVSVVAYCGALALLSAWILNRREVALPSR